MSGQDFNTDKLIKVLYDFAVEKMKANASDGEILAGLMAKGLDRDCSQIIVSNVRKAFLAARKQN
jgi:hypothetical protein